MIVVSFAVHGKLLSVVFPPALTCSGDLNEEVLLSQWMLARTFTAVKYGFRLFFHYTSNLQQTECLGEVQINGWYHSPRPNFFVKFPTEKELTQV